MTGHILTMDIIWSTLRWHNLWRPRYVYISRKLGSKCNDFNIWRCTFKLRQQNVGDFVAVPNVKKISFEYISNLSILLFAMYWGKVHLKKYSQDSCFVEVMYISTGPLFTKRTEVSKPRVWMLWWSYHFEIWQASRQRCCRHLGSAAAGISAALLPRWLSNVRAIERV